MSDSRKAIADRKRRNRRRKEKWNEKYGKGDRFYFRGKECIVEAMEDRVSSGSYIGTHIDEPKVEVSIVKRGSPSSFYSDSYVPESETKFMGEDENFDTENSETFEVPVSKLTGPDELDKIEDDDVKKDLLIADL